MESDDVHARSKIVVKDYPIYYLGFVEFCNFLF